MIIDDECARCHRFLRGWSGRVRERLASYHLRPDVLDAAAAMGSDQRSDIYIVGLEAAVTDSETVLRMMDGRRARVIGLLVLTSERILSAAAATGPTSACRWRRSVPSRPTRRRGAVPSASSRPTAA